jgi:thiamine biosynthesis lipoprotein ApbE
VRWWRLGVVLFAAVLLRQASEQPGQDVGGWIPLGWARQIFPGAVVVGRPDVRGVQQVRDGDGRLLGGVLQTSPVADDVVGYSGPNNLLVGLGGDGSVVGVVWMESGDTESHVRSVRAEEGVLSAYAGWRPQSGQVPEPVVVSGSTLTSLAVAEALRRRVEGESGSLRFSEPVRVEEVRRWFPEAVRLVAVPVLGGVLEVCGVAGERLGYVLSTAPHGDNERGYRGPTEALVAVAADQETLVGVAVRGSYDTGEYVGRVREAGGYLDELGGWSVSEWGGLDLAASGLEGVSGATQTSYGLAAALKARFAAAVQQAGGVESAAWGWKRVRSWLLFLLVCGGVGMSFSSLRGRPWVRLGWQAMVVVVLGLLLGDLVSLALLAAVAGSAFTLETGVGVLLLVAVALVVPWGTGRQVYCHQLCPHGVLQEWLRRLPSCRGRVPSAWDGWLRKFPGILLVLAFLVAIRGGVGGLAEWEAFDAWSLGWAAPVSLAIALLGLVVAAFYPMAYCRYGCATGGLLRFLRKRGASGGWALADSVALVCLGLGVLPWVLGGGWRDCVGSGPGGGQVDRVVGMAFGTSWSVTMRQPVADPVALKLRMQAELDEVEHVLSHWHRESVTAQFNALESSLPMEVPGRLLEVLEIARSVGGASGGALDVTVGPLARKLGFGPADGRLVDGDPVGWVGWDRLRVDVGQGTLRKLHPRVELDLGALLQGYGADCLVEVLRAEGVGECLVDVGGELRAVGEWNVGIEDPLVPGRPLAGLRLRDQALATSGVYRGSLSDGAGGKVAHILDPRAGVPVDHDTVLVAVVAPTGVLADAWSTALLVVGGEGALKLAGENGVLAFVVRRDGQQGWSGPVMRPRSD